MCFPRSGQFSCPNFIGRCNLPVTIGMITVEKHSLQYKIPPYGRNLSSRFNKGLLTPRYARGDKSIKKHFVIRCAHGSNLHSPSLAGSRQVGSPVDSSFSSDAGRFVIPSVARDRCDQQGDSTLIPTTGGIYLQRMKISQ